MWPTANDPRVTRLDQRLREARQAVVDLLREPFRAHVEARYQCRTRREGRDWERKLVALGVKSATILSREEGSYVEPRAYCPLCEAGSSAAYARGFAHPEGLRRHLAGEFRVHQCKVTTTLFWMARGDWEDTFREAEEAAAAAGAERRTQRAAVEPLYRTRADGAALLCDEGLGYDGRPRDGEGLNWADARLRTLGFEPTTEDRVTEYRREIDGYTVHADPRRAGRLIFVVTPPAPPLTPRRRGPEPERQYQEFDLPDRLTRELPAKFAARLADAVATFTARLPRSRRPALVR